MCRTLPAPQVGWSILLSSGSATSNAGAWKEQCLIMFRRYAVRREDLCTSPLRFPKLNTSQPKPKALMSKPGEAPRLYESSTVAKHLQSGASSAGSRTALSSFSGFREWLWWIRERPTLCLPWTSSTTTSDLGVREFSRHWPTA